ncbi:hypothetical protein V6N12_024414 [Hibiscus sabdariffa]|uniref:RNase H type-1 domain-containing protein n=1 Tax=Hibiscus sabdariffa TaxID=183260 RepID=A0ABR2G0L2_9ROSI
MLSLVTNEGSSLESGWVRWGVSNDGKFSVKYFIGRCSLSTVSDFPWKSLVWCGFSPPKVESFVWLVISSRVPVRVELFNRRCLPDNDVLCPLCKKDVETTRVAWWVTAKFPSSFLSLDAIVANPRLADLVSSVELTPVVPTVWKPPPAGWLKFNVDGAARGDGLLGGIGGILKNEFGVSLLSFSSRVGVSLPVLPEVLVIFYCIWLFLKSEFYGRYNLVVASDCKVAINWIREPSNAPSCMKTWIYKIAEVSQLNMFLFLYVDRVINMEADSLAKVGISSMEVFSCSVSDI